MNEQIKLLLRKAGFLLWQDEPWNPGDVVDWSCRYDNELAKLVELVASECAGIAAGSDMPSKDIKEHFGIKEHPGWVCSKCGIDRTREVCPKGHTAVLTGECPMIAVAQ